MSSMLTFESRFWTYIIFLRWDWLSCCNGVKIGLVSICKCLFYSFLLDFPIFSSIAVWVSTKDFISSSLEFSSFFKYSTFSLSKSVLPFWLTSKFFKTWFKVSEKVLSLLSIIEISQLTRLLSADSCVSIFQMSCLFTVFVGMFWVDCIDVVCRFCSIDIAD